MEEDFDEKIWAYDWKKNWVLKVSVKKKLRILSTRPLKSLLFIFLPPQMTKP